MKRMEWTATEDASGRQRVTLVAPEGTTDRELEEAKHAVKELFGFDVEESGPESTNDGRRRWSAGEAPR